LLASSGTSLLSRGHSARLEILRKTTTAVLAFLDRRPISKLYAIEKDPFALPKELEPSCPN
jgi:hypothetical protein